jgi:CRISPR-associated protein Cmr2
MGELLLIAIGPVQGFIVQARRTRDLWFGSHLLSEVARAAARRLAESDCELIFPALDRGNAELEPCDALLRPSGRPPLPIANKLLAYAQQNAAELCLEAERAARERWEELARTAYKRAERLLARGTEAVWREQVASFLEIEAVWQTLSDYRQTRNELEQALGARKGLRRFAQWRCQRAGVPKSSLDGERESLLAPTSRRDRQKAARYRIADGEQLDAVGLAKRLGGEPEQFLPVANVAAASWVEHARQRAPKQLEELAALAGNLNIQPVRSRLRAARHWPHDGTVLYRSRLQSAFAEQGLEESGRGRFESSLGRLYKAAGSPAPYVACLIADGDEIGKLIGEVEDRQNHRRLSQALSKFASEARTAIEDHLGLPIYGGGDDVLCLLPVDRAVACAAELRTRFANALGGVSRSIEPTLSVGIGIAHIMEAMGDLLAIAREAERLAKADGHRAQPRNALAVIAQKRSGGAISWRANWDEDPAAQLERAERLLAEQLSTSALYAIDSRLRLLGGAHPQADGATAQALRGEVLWQLSHSGFCGFEHMPPELTQPGGDPRRLEASMRMWADTLLLALTLIGAKPGGLALARAMPGSSTAAQEAA